MCRAIAFSPQDPRHSRESGNPEVESGNRLTAIVHFAKTADVSRPNNVQAALYTIALQLCPGSFDYCLDPLTAHPGIVEGLEFLSSTKPPPLDSGLRRTDGGLVRPGQRMSGRWRRLRSSHGAAPAYRNLTPGPGAPGARRPAPLRGDDLRPRRPHRRPAGHSRRFGRLFLPRCSGDTGPGPESPS